MNSSPAQKSCFRNKPTPVPPEKYTLLAFRTMPDEMPPHADVAMATVIGAPKTEPGSAHNAPYCALKSLFAVQPAA